MFRFSFFTDLSFATCHDSALSFFRCPFFGFAICEIYFVITAVLRYVICSKSPFRIVISQISRKMRHFPRILFLELSFFRFVFSIVDILQISHCSELSFSDSPLSVLSIFRFRCRSATALAIVALPPPSHILWSRFHLVRASFDWLLFLYIYICIYIYIYV